MLPQPEMQYSLTVGASITRSGAGAAPTVTVTAGEQLLVASDSPDTAFHARAVVVGPWRGRSGQADRLVSAPQMPQGGLPSPSQPPCRRSVIVESVDWK